MSIVKSLTSVGIRFEVKDGQRLRFGPPEKVTAEIQNIISRNKKRILRELLVSTGHYHGLKKTAAFLNQQPQSLLPDLQSRMGDVSLKVPLDDEAVDVFINASPFSLSQKGLIEAGAKNAPEYFEKHNISIEGFTVDELEVASGVAWNILKDNASILLYYARCLRRILLREKGLLEGWPQLTKKDADCYRDMAHKELMKELNSEVHKSK